MKPIVQDEDMEDDLAAEEENKLINEVWFLLCQPVDVTHNTLAGVQNLVSKTVIYTSPGCSDYLTGRKMHRISMTW